MTIPTLTFFYINERNLQPNGEVTRREWFTHVSGSLKLPRLRALILVDTTAPPAVVYSFIQRRPTILKVHVSSGRKDQQLSMGALIKLIDGSGIWDVENSNGMPPDDPADFNRSRDCIPICAYSFTRVVNEEALSDNPSGRPRYLVTSLALEQTDCDVTFDYPPKLLDKMRDLTVFSKLESLFLYFKECYDEKDNFSSIIVSYPYSHHLVACITKLLLYSSSWEIVLDISIAFVLFI